MVIYLEMHSPFYIERERCSCMCHAKIGEVIGWRVHFVTNESAAALSFYSLVLRHAMHQSVQRYAMVHFLVHKRMKKFLCLAPDSIEILDATTQVFLIFSQKRLLGGPPSFMSFQNFLFLLKPGTASSFI